MFRSIIVGSILAALAGCSERAAEAPATNRVVAADGTVLNFAAAPGASAQATQPVAAPPGAPAPTAQPVAAPPSAQRAPEIRLRLHTITDPQQGGLAAGTIAVPENWRVQSRIEWHYGNVTVPVHGWVRAEAPDGSAWVEMLPQMLFYAMQPPLRLAVGHQSLGMTYYPGITVGRAIDQYAIRHFRGKIQGLEVVGARPVPGLAQAFNIPQVSGDALSVRLRYTYNGASVDEEFYGLLSSPRSIPFTGPQGTWHEIHRWLVAAHAIGATNGRLDAMRQMLGYIAVSLKADPAWLAHKANVERQLKTQFDAMIARGYDSIRAAAQLSKTISANNDAMLASMQAQRQAQAASDAARRAASQAAANPNQGFSEYMRGVQTMHDPYRGTSEQSYHQRYHWTDGHGNYRSSNDSGFNPNIGSGGGVTWQRMEPVR